MNDELKCFLQKNGLRSTNNLIGKKSAQSSVFELETIDTNDKKYAVLKVFKNSEPQISVNTEYRILKSLKRLVTGHNCTGVKKQESRAIILLHFSYIAHQLLLKSAMKDVRILTLNSYLKFYFQTYPPPFQHPIYVYLVVDLLNLYNRTGYFHGDLHSNNIIVIHNKRNIHDIHFIFSFDFGRSYKIKSKLLQGKFNSLSNAWCSMHKFLDNLPVRYTKYHTLYKLYDNSRPITSDMGQLDMFTNYGFVDNLLLTDEFMYGSMRTVSEYLFKVKRPRESWMEYKQRCFEYKPYQNPRTVKEQKKHIMNLQCTIQ